MCPDAAVMSVGFAALLASLALAAGCGTGGSEPPASAPATSTSSAPVSPTSPDTSAESTLPVAPADVVVVDFTAPASVDGWSTQNDTVMGGVSSATVGWSEGAMVFSGDLSLANNGGFTSAVSPLDPVLGELSAGAEAFVIEGVGDGRVYVLQLIGGQGGQQRWTQPFTVPEGSQQLVSGQVVLPFSDFTATDFRLNPAEAEPVDPSTLIGVAIYLVDDQPGPFRLAINSLAVREL